MPDTTSPSWNALYATAELQAGYFTTAQGAEADPSPQLLYKHLKAGRIRRVRRGIYRLVHFPMSDEEHLVECWLWAEQAGVFSHETALFYHDLSNVLPKHVYLTVPEAWRGRRLRVPEGLVLHYGSSQRPSGPGAVRSRSRSQHERSTTSSTPIFPQSTSSEPSPRRATVASSTGTTWTASQRDYARCKEPDVQVHSTQMDLPCSLPLLSGADLMPHHRHGERDSVVDAALDAMDAEQLRAR